MRSVGDEQHDFNVSITVTSVDIDPLSDFLTILGGDVQENVSSAVPGPESASGSTGVLLSTRWNQSGKFNNNTTITYNEYTPMDGDEHSVTGCTNTAAGQLIYYFIDKQELQLTLALNPDDVYTSSYTSETATVTIDVKADGSTPGTLSFDEINGYLADFQTDSAEHAAALVYACGVVQKADYSANATSTAWSPDLFYRSGFTSITHGGPFWTASNYYWGGKNSEGKYYISDAGFEVLIENLEAGRPVGTSYPGHALVIDGYDRDNDQFHINFGWGNHSSTRWYTRKEMQDQQYYEFLYDLRIDYQEVFTVTDSRLYGTGTMIRAFEQANSMKGDNTVVFDDAVAGELLVLQNQLTVLDNFTADNINMHILVTDSDSTWGIGFNADDNDSSTVFEFSGGSLVVNTEQSTNAAFYAYNGSSCTVNADHALIYSGSYSVSGDYSDGAQSVLSSLQNARENGLEPDSSLIYENSYSFFDSVGNDQFTLANSSLAVGDVKFRGGDDTLTVTGDSRLYGSVISDSGNDRIIIDSSSSVIGDIYGDVGMTFVLENCEDHSLFTALTNAYNIYHYASVTVDMTEAELGTYLLFSAQEAENSSSLEDISVTITGSGVDDYVLSVNGTSSYADLLFEGGILKLQIKNQSAVLAHVTSVESDIKTLTNGNVSVSATYSDDTVYAEYSLDGHTWLPYVTPVVMTANGMVYFRAGNSAGVFSKTITHNVANIDKTPPQKPTISASTAAVTNQNVILTATYSDDSVTKQYSTNNKTWKTYSGSVTVSSNSTFYFRGIDEAGNISAVTSYSVTNIDKVAPVKPTASADTTAPTNQNVTVTASFSNDTTTRQYSLDNETWKTYRSGVVMSDNGTVYFRGIDAAGNISETTSYIVSNITDSVPEPEPEPNPETEPTPEPTPEPVGPAAPKVSADITAATTKDVTVTATFGADAVTKQYSFNQSSWQEYTGGVVMKDNGTVYFRAGNADGLFSDPVSYTVTNIDRVPPAKPTASADITGSTKQNVTVTAAFSEDTVTKQYSLDNLVWNNYSNGVSFSRNGTVYFRGIDGVGNISDVTSFTVNNIQADQYEISGNQDISKTVKLGASGKYMLTGSFGSDVSGSVTLLSGGKKAGSGTIKDGVLTFNSGKPVLLDSKNDTVIQVTVKKGDASKYDLHLDAESVFPDYDPAGSDVKSALNLGTASSAGQQLVPNGWVGYGDDTDYYAVKLASGANFSLTCKSSDAVKLTLYSASTGKAVLSSSIKGEGTVTAKPKLLDAGDYYLAVQSTNAKKGGSADYSVNVSKDTVFYTKGNNSDDWTDMKTKGKSGAVDKTTIGKLTGSSSTLFTDWVGSGDTVDYKAFTLESGAKLVFDVSSTDAAKFTVYQLVEAKGGNKLTARLSSTAIAAPKNGSKQTKVTTKEVQLEAGTYYIAMASTNAGKGGSADYTVAVNQKSSKFYPAGNPDNNTWQAAKKSSAVKSGDAITGWVGFGDVADFIKFQVAGDGQIKLDLDQTTAKALSGKEIKLSCLNANGKSVALANFDRDTLVSKKPVLAGEYYLGVTCANVKKFDTSYSITTGLVK